MKIAAVTTSYNEYYALDSFEKYLKDYWDELYLHIIVDNNSDEDYKEELKKRFIDSVLIFRKKNGGTTAAFNDGIKYAIKNNADAILLITQDIKLKKGSITNLIKYFTDDKNIGIVGPLLFKSDGKTIEEYGGKVDYDTFKVEKYYSGETDYNSLPKFMFVDFISGGINITRKEVFFDVGLQDEFLFMYADETDFAYRAKKKGWKLLVTKDAIAYHMHHNVASSLKPRNLYLMTRNQLLLINKHRNFNTLIKFFLKQLKGLVRRVAHYTKRKKINLAIAYTFGVFNGFFIGTYKRIINKHYIENKLD